MTQERTRRFPSPWTVEPNLPGHCFRRFDQDALTGKGPPLDQDRPLT
jgi:hypothetical protein